jgi:hypothetical protein
MNYQFSGANMRHSTRPCISKGKHGHMVSQLAIPALLSTLELRQLVAAMVD